MRSRHPNVRASSGQINSTHQGCYEDGQKQEQREEVSHTDAAFGLRCRVWNNVLDRENVLRVRLVEQRVGIRPILFARLAHQVADRLHIKKVLGFELGQAAAEAEKRRADDLLPVFY